MWLFVTLRVLQAARPPLCLQRWLLLRQRGWMQPAPPPALPARQPGLTALLLWLPEAFAAGEHPWVQCSALKSDTATAAATRLGEAEGAASQQDPVLWPYPLLSVCRRRRRVVRHLEEELSDLRFQQRSCTHRKKKKAIREALALFRFIFHLDTNCHCALSGRHNEGILCVSSSEG